MISRLFSEGGIFSCRQVKPDYSNGSVHGWGRDSTCVLILSRKRKWTDITETTGKENPWRIWMPKIVYYSDAGLGSESIREYNDFSSFNWHINSIFFYKYYINSIGLFPFSTCPISILKRSTLVSITVQRLKFDLVNVYIFVLLDRLQ